jgi:hypothetical protein
MRWNVQGSRSRPNMSLKQGDGIFIKKKMCVVVCPWTRVWLREKDKASLGKGSVPRRQTSSSQIICQHGLHPPLEEHPVHQHV